ncbi:MAG: DUF2336 domain-containing protein [Rhodospirillaceae bacterium]
MSQPADDLKAAKRTAATGDEKSRITLAARTDIPPELLYFLANDLSIPVRQAVAGNPVTPRQADLLLSRDADAGVRCLLARKIVGTGLDGDRRSQLWRMGFTILETLARDQSLRVRRALADAIRFMFHVPRGIAVELARDAEPRVAVPVLRDSPVLTDDDLVGIVEEGAPDWAQQAIAARERVSERVSAAIVDAGATPTVTRLLKNHRADIGEPSLERIVGRARSVEAWHEPLVHRPSLPERLAGRIGMFVKGPLKSILAARRKPAVPGVSWSNSGDGRTQGRVGWSPRKKKPNGHETSRDRARRLHAEGKLNDAVMELALNANERDFVMAALALRAGVPLWGVERIVKGATGKGMTALCWKAGIQMRFAIDLQRRLARVPQSRIVNARDGFEYPFTDDEMESRLELLLA